MCHIEQRMSTEATPERNTSMDVNAAFVIAAVSMGRGPSQLYQKHVIAKIPSLTTRQYFKY